jgi:hypothetical protein
MLKLTNFMMIRKALMIGTRRRRKRRKRTLSQT